MFKKKYLIISFISIVQITSLVDGFSAYAQEGEGMARRLTLEESKLSEVKKEIELNKKEILKKEKREKSLFYEIEKFNDELEIMNQELRIYEWNLKGNAIKKKKLGVKISKLSESLQEKQKTVGKRLKIIYKDGSRMYLKSVLSAKDFNNTIQKIKYINIVTKYDWQIINDFKEKISKLNESKRQLKDLEDEIRLYKNKALKKKKAIKKKIAGKRDLIAYVSSKKDFLKKASVALEKKHNRLKDIIDGLYLKKTQVNYEIPDFAYSKGKLSWPISGKVISRFGKIKNKKINAYLFNNGIDIQAPLGADVKSVYKGVVIYSDRLEGYGRVVILDHGGFYYSLYGHLSSPDVLVGDVVKVGQVIAGVGRIGTLNDAESLYFEIRHRGKPEDPHKWLKKR